MLSLWPLPSVSLSAVAMPVSDCRRVQCGVSFPFSPAAGTASRCCSCPGRQLPWAVARPVWPLSARSWSGCLALVFRTGRRGGTGKIAAGSLKSPVVVQVGVLTALLVVDQGWLHDEHFWHPLLPRSDRFAGLSTRVVEHRGSSLAACHVCCVS